jgi:hypothetical protein
MTLSKLARWDEWLDKSTLGGMPLKIKPNAPDEVKKSFKEWQEINAEYDKQWEQAEKKRSGKPNKAVQEFIDILTNMGTR